ncbi:MAG: hypothetical protein ACPHO4_04450 [Longimicrobiales bacterium]
MDSVSAFEVAWFEAQEVAPETGAEEPSSTQSEPARAEVPSRIGEISPDWTLPVPNPSPATDTVPPIDTLRFTAFRESG